MDLDGTLADLEKELGDSQGPGYRTSTSTSILLGYAKLVSEVPRCRATGLILSKFVLRHWTFGDNMTR